MPYMPDVNSSRNRPTHNTHPHGNLGDTPSSPSPSPFSYPGPGGGLMTFPGGGAEGLESSRQSPQGGSSSSNDASSMLQVFAGLLSLKMLLQAFQGNNSNPGMTALPPALPMPGGGTPPASMKMEQDYATRPTAENSKRPSDDNRTADDIINDDGNAILKNLGNQKDIKQEELKRNLGDWTENNPDPDSRADAAYAAAKYLNYIDNLKDRDGNIRKDAGDGDLHGITSDGDARSGTEAGVNVDCARASEREMAKSGDKEKAKQAFYDALPENGRLPGSNNKRDAAFVRPDGTNKDEVQGNLTKVGNALWFIPGLSNVLTGMGNAAGDFGSMLLGGFQGAIDTAAGSIEGLFDGIKNMKLNPFQMLKNMYTGALQTTEAPQQAKDIVKNVNDIT